jgi:hypothetical protein
MSKLLFLALASRARDPLLILLPKRHGCTTASTNLIRLGRVPGAIRPANRHIAP